MTIIEKVMEKSFGKYAVSLELFEESGEQRADCWIEYKTYCSSLALASDLGFLEGDACGEHDIPEKTVKRISDWATANGY